MRILVSNLPFWKQRDFWTLMLFMSMISTFVLWVVLLVSHIGMWIKLFEVGLFYKVCLCVLACCLVSLALSFYKACTSQQTVGWRDVLFFIGVVLAFVFVVLSIFLHPLELWVPYVTAVWGTPIAIIWARSTYDR